MDDTQCDDDDIHRHHQQQQPDAFLLINNTPIRFSEDWNTGIGGGLWSTGLAFAQYLEHRSEDVLANLRRLALVKKYSASSSRWHGSDQIDSNNTIEDNSKERLHRHDVVEFNGISALELGSGNGFLSACLLALVMSDENNNIPLMELAITDMKDHLPLMFKTLKENSRVWDTLTYDDGEQRTVYDGRLSSSATTTRPVVRCMQRSPHIIVAEHVWGEFEFTHNSTTNNNHLHNKKYDFIFGTDLAYRNSLHVPLISSLLHFSHQHTLCLIGVTMTDTQPIFFDRLTEAGFRYEKLADHLLQREFRGGNFGLIAIQRR
ncbi:hypothetical protein ACHAXH_002027 [Discostella pseudostelligera]